MKDAHKHLDHALVVILLWLMLLALACVAAACAPVQVGPKELPQACPEPLRLDPIPETVHLTIEPGKRVKADDGARRLLENYVRARSAGLR